MKIPFRSWESRDYMHLIRDVQGSPIIRMAMCICVTGVCFGGRQNKTGRTCVQPVQFGCYFLRAGEKPIRAL